MMNLKMLTFAFLLTGYGLLMTMGARIDTRITSLAACVNGSITLSGNDPSRFQIRDQWWKFRYHNEDWTDIRYCDGNLNCVTMSLLDGNELPDGTKVSIGAHESLIVQRTAQNNTKDRIQFLLEIYFQNNSVLRHSFEVNFTVVCVWTRLQANLNLSRVFLGQYPLEQLKEIQLLDENGTYFAYMHTRNGASLNVTDDRSLMPPYWNRLKITRGSLILSGITKADNGTTIRSKAFLNDPAIKTSIGSVSVKTIRIFVFNSTGLLMTMGARIDTRITSLAACVNGSITLSGNDPSRFQIRDQWWKFRYHNEDWTDIRYCNGSLNCVTWRSELPDGTRVSIGAHESLIVQRTAQNNTKDRIQFLLEVYFHDSSVLRHSFEVNFTVVCVWTRLQGNLNLSQVFLGQYPLEQLKEIQLLDENGTYFAYMHTRNGASLNVTDDRSLMPLYWNRLKITRGSLILSGITKADNGTTIRSRAFLNDPAIKTSIGSVSVKTIRIFVFNSTDPSRPPSSFLPNSSFSSTPGELSRPTKSAGQGTVIVIILVVLAAMILIIALIVIIIFKKGLCCFRPRGVGDMPRTDRPADQC